MLGIRMEKFVSSLFQANVTESEKLKLIYQVIPKLDEVELREIINRLGADPRYHKLLVAVINAAKNANLAIEQLFNGHPAITEGLSRLKWLYTKPGEGFVDEKFLRTSLPRTSFVCQRKIVNGIARWLNNPQVGDKLHEIVKNTSGTLASLLLPACSNERIVAVLSEKHARPMNSTQMLYILKNRFKSAVELYEDIWEKNLEHGINHESIIEYISVVDPDLAIQLSIKRDLPMSRGRRTTRSFVDFLKKNDLSLPKTMSYLKDNAKNFSLKSLKHYLTFEQFVEVFLHVFKDSMAPDSKMMGYMDHLVDEKRREMLTRWIEYRFGGSVIENAEKINLECLYLFDDEQINQLVKERLRTNKFAGKLTSHIDDGQFFWESMLRSDDEVFEMQRKRLSGESKADVRLDIYQCMIWSSTQTKRYDTLQRRLEFVAKRTRNEKCQVDILNIFDKLLSKDGKRPKITADFWNCIKEIYSSSILFETDSAQGLESMLVKIFALAEDEVLKKDVSNFFFELHTVHEVSWHKLRRGLIGKERKNFWSHLMESYEKSIPDRITGDVINDAKGFFNLCVLEDEITKENLKRCPKSFNLLKHILAIRDDPTIFHYQLRAYYLTEHLLRGTEVMSSALQKHLDEKRRELEEARVINDFKKSKVMDEFNYELLSAACVSNSSLYDIVSRAIIHSEEKIQEIFIKALDNAFQNDESPNVLRLIALCSSVEDFHRRVKPLFPTEMKFSAVADKHTKLMYRKQERVANAIKYVHNSRAGAEMILKFTAGDYLSHSLGAFYHHFSHLAPEDVPVLLSHRVLDTEAPVSARKHFVRALLRFGPPSSNSEVIEQLLEASENDTVKTEALKLVYALIAEKNRDENLWPLIQGVIEHIRAEDRTTLQFLFESDEIDCFFDSGHLLSMITKLYDLTQNKEYAIYHDSVLNRIIKSFDKLPFDYIRSMFKKMLISEDCSRNQKYAYEFSMFCTPDRLEELDSDLHSVSMDEHADQIALFFEQLAAEIVRKRGRCTKDFTLLLSLMMNFSNEQSDTTFFIPKLQLRFLIPIYEKFRLEQTNLEQTKLLAECGLIILQTVMDNCRVELFSVVVKVLLVTIEQFKPEKDCDLAVREKMAEVYSESLTALQVMALVDLVSECGWRQGNHTVLAKIGEAILSSKKWDYVVTTYLRSKLSRSLSSDF